MAQQNEEHLEVISKNKAKAYEEQKSMRQELIDWVNSCSDNAHARTSFRDEKNEKELECQINIFAKDQHVMNKLHKIDF